MTPEIRRYRHTLVITGGAVILFGLWDIAKSILQLMFTQPLVKLVEQQTDALEQGDLLPFLLFTIVILVIFFMISFSIRLCVGRTAIAVGKGETRRCKIAIFWALFLLAVSASGPVLTVILYTEQSDVLNMAASILVDVTSIIILVGMLRSFYMVRKLTAAKKDG